jgi:HD-like signal output (HDOD) protein
MLHDVGKLIMAWKLPESFNRFMAVGRKEQCPLHIVEERENGFSHAEMGGYLLGLWGLPYAVAEAVALHHAPSRVDHQSFDAAAAVYIANLLANELGPSPQSPMGAGLQSNQEYLISLGVEEDIPHWRAMAAEAAPRLAWA